MNRDEVRQTLRVLAAAYPPVQVSEETVAVWESVMDRWGAAEALDVALAWIETEPRFPTINAFLEALQAAARRRLALVAAEERARGALPPGEVPTSEHRAVVGVHLLKEALKAGAAFDPDEFMRRVEVSGAAAPVTTVACLECNDTRMVEMTPGRFRPCQRCRPEQHGLWRAGHFDPGHPGCEVCRPSKRRKRDA